ncbi:hypothetical protein PF005_g10455 [Phytophthora fragariae]|uniref:Uncharacterized protein n=1 Tax=Phytophthora fragariae TaxID=53985 RepID=A0A6A3Y649_9STRA|nr:hypothetical protein PF003_g15073 [Phytophthora fragariae]KAE8929272.1 hypothetical protein PF009_g20612 [Phytophthora fragariae]KAE9008106.1 hypothetical protein PF011_g10830 [Phytophthora fragariae]KAE9091707.1 hypothetical protein PF010_g18086 [Phytophthora fragariae]KAE9120050.1 hypothetical protein PF006_g18219 [Phytophthora fragariae]
MEPNTPHVLHDVTYAVSNVVKCSKKLHSVARTRIRSARLLERLRRSRGYRSGADCRRHAVQHRARVAQQVVRGADLPEERQRWRRNRPCDRVGLVLVLATICDFMSLFTKLSTKYDSSYNTGALLGLMLVAIVAAAVASKSFQ